MSDTTASSDNGDDDDVDDVDFCKQVAEHLEQVREAFAFTGAELDVAERLARRRVKSHGLTLCKSRRRDPQALDYGNYWIIDPDTNTLVAGDQFGMTIGDVIEWLDA